jgi:hypothetical protein
MFYGKLNIEEFNKGSRPLNSFGSSNSRSIGPEIVCCSAWKLLGLDEILGTLGFDEREINLSKIVIMGRLIRPERDLSTWEWFRNRSSLRELLPESSEDIGHNAIYEITDLLLSHKEAIEKAFYTKTNGVHNVAPSVFLFDLTNLYFEGQCKRNELAMFGKSKEKRSDCRLVILALNGRSAWGFPLEEKSAKATSPNQQPSQDFSINSCQQTE